MKKIFTEKGTFQAYYAAEKWLRNNGYSFGSSCVCSPQAIKKGDFYIAKWRNLSAKERKDIDGIIEGQNHREGPVVVDLFKE